MPKHGIKVVSPTGIEPMTRRFLTPALPTELQGTFNFLQFPIELLIQFGE